MVKTYAERWVRSVKEECLFLFGESSLRRALQQYIRAELSGQRQRDPVSCVEGKGKKEKGSNTVSGATGWSAEILRVAGSIKVQGRQVLGVAICTYIKDPSSLP
jgi:hypothetical protein